MRQLERDLYLILREWLSQQHVDLLDDFERDPLGTEARLRAFLEEAGDALPARLATCVSGGQVERIVNIARVENLCIQPPDTTRQEQGASRLSNVPQLPPHFLPRLEHFEPLKAKVLGSARENQLASTIDSRRKIGVLGMSGIGKSVLAAALARDEEVRRAFPHSIIWVTLGRTPALTARQAQVATALDGNPYVFEDVQRGRSRLGEMLEDKACLLILDDVWNTKHIHPFDVLGSRGLLLLTTRDAGLTAALGAVEHRVSDLDDKQALRLLARWADVEQGAILSSKKARDVTQACGNLPLALAMVGAMLRGRPENRWDNVLHRLRTADLDKICRQFPNYPYPNLLRAIYVSVEGLEAKVQPRYLDLAVFPDDVPIPEAALRMLWMPEGLNRYDTQDVMDKVVEGSLARRDERGDLVLHNLHREYVRRQVEDLPSLHRRLLDAYAKQCPGSVSGTTRWPTGPRDGYFFHHLPYHLKEDGRERELRDLLLDFDWLQTKLEATDVNALLMDYDVVLTQSKDKALQLTQAAIRLSAHILNHDKTQLWSQLYGRLMAHDLPDIEEMLSNSPGIPWLRTLIPSLRHAGGALLRTLAGHSGPVKAVAVTPDGQYAISVSKDKPSDEVSVKVPTETLNVWDLERGVQSTPESYSEVNAVAITPDGRWGVLALSDGTLRVLDISDMGSTGGTELYSLKGHTAPVWAVAVTETRDRCCAVSASGDGTLKVWDLESGKKIETLKGHRGSVWAVAATLDGQCVISASNDKTLKVWDLERWRERCTLEGHMGPIWAVAVTPDGRRAVSSAKDKTLRVWDLENERELWRLPSSDHPIKAVVVTADGHRVVSTFEDRMLKVWDLERGAEICMLEGHTQSVNALAAARDGVRVVSAADDRTLRIWDISDANLDSDLELPKLEHHIQDVNVVALTGDGCRAISSSKDKTLKVWDVSGASLEPGSELYTLGDHGEPVSAMAVTPDGERALSGATDGTLKVWDISDTGLGQVVGLHILKGHARSDSATRGINAVIVTLNGQRAVSASSDKTLKVWDLEHGIELRTLKGHKDDVNAVAVTPDGWCAVSASSDRTLKVWNVASGMVKHTLKGHKGFVEAVAVSPDGRRAVSASRDQTLKVWDLERGEEIQTLNGHTDEVLAVAITPDGQWIVSASRDKTLKVWGLEREEEIRTLEGHTAWIGAVEVTSNGRYTVSVSGDGTLKVWELKSSNVTATFTAGAEDALLACAVARDSRTIVAGGKSGRVHILRLEGI